MEGAHALAVRVDQQRQPAARAGAAVAGCGPLDLQRDDRPAADVQRRLLARAVEVGEGGTGEHAVVVPVVVPAAGRQGNVALLLIGDDRGDEQVRA